jgi:hypothetical protein
MNSSSLDFNSLPIGESIRLSMASRIPAVSCAEDCPFLCLQSFSHHESPSHYLQVETRLTFPASLAATVLSCDLSITHQGHHLCLPLAG